MPTREQLRQMWEAEFEFPETRRSYDPLYKSPKLKTPTMEQSNEPMIDQINAVIAEFMGGPRCPHPDQPFFPEPHWGYKCHKGHWWNEKNLEYHNSWDWLMPVWYKFRDLRFSETKLQLQHSNWKTPIDNAICYQSIQSTHLLLFNAIQWYNQNTNNGSGQNK